MATVHFTTIPCELNIPNKHIESHIFCAKFVHVLTTFCMLGLQFFRTFLMNFFRLLTRKELWVNVPIVIFFGTRWIGAIESEITSQCIRSLPDCCNMLTLEFLSKIGVVLGLDAGVSLVLEGSWLLSRNFRKASWT